MMVVRLLRFDGRPTRISWANVHALLNQSAKSHVQWMDLERAHAGTEVGRRTDFNLVEEAG